MYYTYILYSTTKSRFYVGQTNDVDDRINRHNKGQSLSTKSGIPWKMIYSISLNSRSEAVLLETKIKKRGAKRYLEDIGFEYEM
jgi:putative endonuclease